jgi:putative oxidoreductase
MAMRRLLATNGPRAVVLVRLIVGVVFASEGIQKFLFPGALGVGRFAKIGLPVPDLLAPLVGAFEVTCGILVLLGLCTRLATVPLIMIMAVAIVTTKVPLLLGKGFWVMAHEARADWSMLLGSVYLLLVGAGRWSVDAVLARQRK